MKKGDKSLQIFPGSDQNQRGCVNFLFLAAICRWAWSTSDVSCELNRQRHFSLSSGTGGRVLRDGSSCIL